MGEHVQIEVVSASASGVRRYPLKVAAGTTAGEVLARPDIDRRVDGTIDMERIGIFGKRVAPTYVLQDGDRLEVYRPLVIDPREARRRRASD